MTDYSNKLVKKVQSALNTSEITEVSVLYALVLLNKVAQDSDVKLPTIALYRDWLVHTDLDRNKQLESLFTQLDKMIDGIAKGGGKQDATKASIEALKLSNLFDEIQNLEITLNSEQKEQFVVGLVNNLLDAPLRWNHGEHIKEFRFTYENSRLESSPSYICHIQFQYSAGQWFDGPEVHYQPKQ